MRGLADLSPISTHCVIYICREFITTKYFLQCYSRYTSAHILFMDIIRFLEWFLTKFVLVLRNINKKIHFLVLNITADFQSSPVAIRHFFAIVRDCTFVNGTYWVYWVRCYIYGSIANLEKNKILLWWYDGHKLLCNCMRDTHRQRGTERFE